MSTKLLGLAFNARMGSINRKIVLLRLVWAADDHGENIYPSTATIARETELSERTVQRMLRKFEAERLVEAVSHKAGGRGQTTIYRLNLATLKRLKGDNGGEKGDSIVTPFSGQKGDSGDSKRVTNEALKGDRALSPDIHIHQDRHTQSFETFWTVYPRKVAKGHARQAFENALKTASAEIIIAGAKRYAAQRHGHDATYTKHPATWLRAECWADEASAKTNGVADDQGTWSREKWKLAIDLAKQRGAWSPNYPPSSTIPLDLLDEELCAIIGGKA